MPAKPPRRRHGEGGMTVRTKTWVNADGTTRSSTYYQASKAVRDADGKRRIVTGNGRTQKEAFDRLTENLVRHRSPGGKGSTEVVEAEVPTLEELFERWHKNNQLRRITDTMVAKYKGYFVNHILPGVNGQPGLGAKRIDKITADDLDLLFGNTLLAKRTRKGKPLLTTAATRNIYMALSSCFRYAVRNGLLVRSPLDGVPAPRKQQPSNNAEEMSVFAARLLALLRADDSPDYCRWLLQFLGLRRAERLGLEWKNIRGLDTDQPTLIIKQQLARRAHRSGGWYLDDRTKNYKERMIVLSEPFISALRAHRAAQDELRGTEGFQPTPEFADLVFLHDDGSIITLNRDNDDWHKVLDHYGLPHWRGHLNRHITATWLAEQDPPVPILTVQSILGHETEAMSQYYTAMTKKQQADPMRRYGEAIARASETGQA